MKSMLDDARREVNNKEAQIEQVKSELTESIKKIQTAETAQESQVSSFLDIEHVRKS